MLLSVLTHHLPTVLSIKRRVLSLLTHIHTEWGTFYKYTADLLCMDLCSGYRGGGHPLIDSVCTPLDPRAWAVALRDHPDRAFVRYLLRGMTEGFRTGFQRTAPLRSAPRNMLSAWQHPDVVQTYLANEGSLSRMLGPFPPSTVAQLPPLHINRFGVIPKGHNPGKWRLITDLSYPPGYSVNDGIDPDLCSLSYSTVEQVAAVVATYSQGALLAKIDIESAYRLIPVHPQDRPLQAVEWDGMIYVDPILPFGLRSAPKIFNAVADALEWCIRKRGVLHIFHYLDDFIVIGPPNSSVCAEALATLDQTCSQLGVPIADHKRDGPTTCLTYLGIEVDTVASQLRLPQEKLHRLQALLAEWGDRKVCGRRELESLIGTLNHACKVVRSGRSFLRRMLDLLHAVPSHPTRPHPIRLNRDFRSDLMWWHTFVASWNGVSFLLPPPYLPCLHMTSDASGSWGCGAWHGHSWFQLQWDGRSGHLPIMLKELLPIVLACSAWGPKWGSRQVICHCDNQAVVACLRSRTSRVSHVMHMLRTLAFIEARYTFSLAPRYIDTKSNHLADDLSRNRLSSFLSKVPQADPRATPLPLPLLDLLLDQTLDWASPRWLQLFSATSGTGSPHRPDARTTQP